MKKLLCIFAILTLTACASTPHTPEQTAQLGYVQACTAYGAAFSAALDARKAGKLSAGQIKSIGEVDAQITPVCTGTLPTDTQSAVVKITAAIASLAAIQGVK